MSAEDPKEAVSPEPEGAAEMVGVTADEAVVETGGADEFLEDAASLKARGAYEQRQRERRNFLASVGITDPDLVDLFGKMEQVDFDATYVFLTSDEVEQETRLDELLGRRLNAVPSYAFTNLRARRRIGTRVSGASRLKADLDADLESIEKSLVLSADIIGRLEEMLAVRRVRHDRLIQHYGFLREKHREAQQAVPPWGAAYMRSLESTGKSRDMLRAKAASIWGGFVDVIRTELGDGAVESPAFVRELERFVKEVEGLPEDAVQSIDGAPDDDDLVVEDHTDIDDTAAFPLDAAIPVPFDDKVPFDSVSAIPNVVPQTPLETPSPAPSGRTVGAFFAGSIGAKTSSDTTADDVRSGGFAMIEGLENEDRFEGVFSQFERGEASPLDASRKARMEEREAFQLSSVKVVDGVLPDAAWMRYEVPYGDYALVQMKGASSVLPRLRDAVNLTDPSAGLVSGMLPPFASMARFGEMVGASDKELKLLAAWDAPGIGEGHMRPSVMDGGRGDPVQAYEVMKRAVAMHLSSVAGAEEAGRITPVTIDHMARFWLFLTVRRMRPSQLELMWPGGFFHGVEGHDVGVGNNGYMRLLRRRSGSIDASIA